MMYVSTVEQSTASSNKWHVPFPILNNTMWWEMENQSSCKGFIFRHCIDSELATETI